MFIKIPSATLSPIIAIIAVYIAYQQYRTNKDKLRLDLYEKRFKVFQEVISLIVKVGNNAAINDVKELFEFSAKTSESAFLFDNDISEYIDLIYQKSVKLYAQGRRLNSPNMSEGPEMAALLEEEEKLLEWFNNQVTICQGKFAKYLKFKD